MRESMTLEEEIKERSQEISTDAYAMSIGEIVSLYKDGELDIHPEFQRFFRWTIDQKSRFIESILLGIPIPSIFVSETENGTWDVVDGLQRLSTILEVMGELKNENGEKYPPLVLNATKYLPHLESCVWKSPGEGQFELPKPAKLKIKRSRLDVKIVLNTSDSKSKYELFQRLNTGGSIATHQEVRNCILIMVNIDFYHWLESLRKNENFQRCIPLSSRQIDEQYDMELVVRFLVLNAFDITEVRKSKELGSYLTERTVDFAENENFDKNLFEKQFNKTFEILASTLGEDSFRKFDLEKNKFSGAFSISMFEIVGLGLGFHCLNENYSISKDELIETIKALWKDPSFVSSTGSGIRYSTRIPITLELGRKLFSK